MKKIKLNLSYNMGNLTSTVSDSKDAGEQILDAIAACFDNFSDAHKVKSHLKNIQKFSASSISSEKRPQVFKMLNYLAGAFFANNCVDDEIYNLCFNAVTQLKDQIDSHPQQDESIAELEWNELEKSVYLLSDWKDQMSTDNTNAAVPLWKN